ncbi:MAG TPA: integrase family protein [Plasticicumulans sp.]|nr:integrase family protein [Plasticicumulans sp.]
MPTTRIKFTKRALEAVPAAAAGKRETLLDTECPALAIRVTDKGVKSFILQRRVNGKPTFVTLGRFPEMTVEQARKAATGAHVQINDGTDPNAVKRADRARKLTLADVLDDYLKGRDLKPRTVAGYRRQVEVNLAEWKDKPLLSISRDMVERKHASLSEPRSYVVNGRSVHRGSEAEANYAMRVLRALMTYAAGKYEDEDGAPILSDIPTRRLSATRAWHRIERRQTVIKPTQLADLHAALWRVQPVRGPRYDDDARAYLELLLLTGLRKNEAAQLRVADVDLAARTLTVPDTKNRRPHTLPLSDRLETLLRSRIEAAGTDPATLLFPHVRDVRRLIERIATETGITFCPHDLRRTFITIAESLDIPAYALKRLLNHKSGADVTAGYIVIDTERLREPMQRITDFMLKAAGVRESAAVVPITRSAGTAG